MKPSVVASVLAADPSATDPATYPLTALSYAMASPSTLDAPAGKDYAAFLRYAAGPGQQPGVAPGQLPLGMVPVMDKLLEFNTSGGQAFLQRAAIAALDQGEDFVADQISRYRASRDLVTQRLGGMRRVRLTRSEASM